MTTTVGRSVFNVLVVAGLCLAALLTACNNQPPPGGRQNVAPSAVLDASPTSGAAPLTVTFDASGSNDPDGTITNYSWNFGDGNSGSGVTARHTYTAAGNFLVTLTVTDNAGATNSAKTTITVTGADGNQPPTASFTATPKQGTAPLTVAFDASGSSDPDGSIASYSWDFGDGNSGSGVTARHTYQSAGNYTVRLTVTDNEGATAQDERTVVVKDDGGKPGAEELQTTRATVAAAEGSPALAVTYIAGSVDAALIATQLNSSSTLVTTGTVTQTGPNSYSYDPSPNDRLRFVRSDGAEFEIVFSELQGDFSKGGKDFLSNDHRAALRVTSNAAGGSLDLTLQSIRLNGQHYRSLQGAFTEEKVRWSVNVQTQGTHSANVDSASYEYKDYIQGTLQAEALGVSVTLGKYYRYKMVNTVENVTHEFDHNWTWNGSSYRLQGRVFVAFTQAQPVDKDQWDIRGELTRDGVVIGQVVPEEDPTGLTIWFELGSERIKLFSFSYL